jgi:hypothetical protein
MRGERESLHLDRVGACYEFLTHTHIADRSVAESQRGELSMREKERERERAINSCNEDLLMGDNYRAL